MIQANEREHVVLVVEDDSDDTFLLDLAAKQFCPDLSFVFVPDGPEALAYLQGEGQLAQKPNAGPPALVLVDSRLKPMDGYTLVRHIRALPQCQQLKVLLWSDGLEPEAEERAQAAGADLFLRKPGSFTELLDEVKRLCELARA